MAVQIPRQAIEDAQGADSELWPVLLAIAGPESSWNPRAIGDGGTSYGYLQMHQGGGLGDGHRVEDLLNGLYNMRAGAAYIRGRLDAGASLWDALQPWSTRPQAWALLQRIQGEGIEGAGSVPSSDYGAGEGDSSGMLLLLALALILIL